MKTISMQDALAHLIQGHHLSREEARQVMSAVMEGDATPAQIGSLMTSIRIKGETTEEITGFADEMRRRAPRVPGNHEGLLDTCGTGGDGQNTFNISTATAIVAAAGGARVAKHGNRAMSSKSGSADVLEALGVNISLTAQQAGQCLDQVGLCFMFSQLFHQSMKHAAGPRKELGFRTFFNILGPLTNPAGADCQLMGVYDRSKTELIASVMRELGLKRALVVASLDGLDEISIAAPTQVTELKNGDIFTYQLSPQEIGLDEAPLDAVVGGDAAENAAMIRSIFDGELGARRDIVLANTGAAFYVTGITPTIAEGVKHAADIIDSGKAKEKLVQLIECTGAMKDVS